MWGVSFQAPVSRWRACLICLAFTVLRGFVTPLLLLRSGNTFSFNESVPAPRPGIVMAPLITGVLGLGLGALLSPAVGPFLRKRLLPAAGAGALSRLVCVITSLALGLQAGPLAAYSLLRRGQRGVGFVLRP